MVNLSVASTFTIVKRPPKGGRYIVFCPADSRAPIPSPYDRVQFFGFITLPWGINEDPMFDGVGSWSLSNAEIVDVFMDHRDDLPIFTIVEQRGKHSRVEQVGGERIVARLKGVWLSTESIRRAIAHGTLELLS